MSGGHPRANGTGADDTEVRDRYHSVSIEKVPQHLDEQILCQAAAEAGRNGGMDRKGSWFRPLGLAAAVALSLAVLLQFETPAPNPVVEDFSSAATEATDRIRDLGETTSASRPPGDPTAASSEQRHCTESESETAAGWWACIDRLRESGLTLEAEAERQRLLLVHPPIAE